MDTIDALQAAIDYLADLYTRYEADRTDHIDTLHLPSTSIDQRKAHEAAAAKLEQSMAKVAEIQGALDEIKWDEHCRRERYLPGSDELVVPYGAPLICHPVDPSWSNI